MLNCLTKTTAKLIKNNLTNFMVGYKIFSQY